MPRMNGTTTRLIDKAVQILFTQGSVIVPLSTPTEPQRGTHAEVVLDPDNQNNFHHRFKERLWEEHASHFKQKGDTFKSVHHVNVAEGHTTFEGTT